MSQTVLPTGEPLIGQFVRLDVLTVADLAELYRLQLNAFIDRNLDSPLALLGPELLTLARRGRFGRLSRHV
ncbi:hypothetical protein ACQ1ZK_17665, partial [Enterococcus faecium]